MIFPIPSVFFWTVSENVSPHMKREEMQQLLTLIATLPNCAARAGSLPWPKFIIVGPAGIFRSYVQPLY